MIRIAVAHQLENQGYKVLTAQNPKELLEILDKEHCDLILMDTNMLSLNDGIEVTKDIRSGFKSLITRKPLCQSHNFQLVKVIYD